MVNGDQVALMGFTLLYWNSKKCNGFHGYLLYFRYFIYICLLDARCLLIRMLMQSNSCYSSGNYRLTTNMWLDLQNHPKWHKNWNPIYSWILKPHSSATHTHQAHGYRWPSLPSHMAFCQPSQTMKVHYRLVEPVNGIIKGVCDAELLPITVSAYLMDCVCFCHLMKTQHCCLWPMEGTTALTTPLYETLKILQ